LPGGPLSRLLEARSPDKKGRHIEEYEFGALIKSYSRMRRTEENSGSRLFKAGTPHARTELPDRNRVKRGGEKGKNWSAIKFAPGKRCQVHILGAAVTSGHT